MTAPRDWIYLVVVSIAATALHWWLYLDGFYAISWDESGRVLDAHRWMSNKFFYDRYWLPGYRVLVGTSLHLHYDLFVTPRVVSYVFGILAIAGTGWLTHELFSDRPITWTAIALSAVFAQRATLALVPLSSIIFAAIVVLSFAMLFRWFNRDIRYWLYLSAVGFAIAGFVKAEGWFFFAVIWFGLVWVRKAGQVRLTIPDLLSVAVITGTFPLIWMIVGYFENQQLLSWAHNSPWSFSPAELIAKNPIVEFVTINLPSLNLLGLISVIWLCKGQFNPRFLAIVAGMALLLISVALLLVDQAQTGPSWRMTAVWGMLLVPFTAHTAWNMGRLFEHPMLVFAARTIAIALISLSSLQQLFAIKNESYWAFPRHELTAGQFLGRLIDSGQAKALIESFDFYHVNILTASQHPNSFEWNSVPLRPQAKQSLIVAGAEPDWDQLQKLEIRYLVFRENEIKNELNASSKVGKLSDFGPWSIYIIRPR